jgi:hypothetical protein
MKNQSSGDTDNPQEPQTDPKDPVEETERALSNIWSFIRCSWLWLGERHNQIVALGTLGILTATSIYAVFSYRQWDATRRSADAAESAAKTAATELELAERPWISSDISIVSPFTFDKDGGHVTLEFTLKNSGHSPGLAWLQTECYPNWKDPTMERDRFCKTVQAFETENPRFLQPVFPGVSIPQKVTVILSKGDIEDARNFLLEHYPGQSEVKKIDLIQPTVVVCIAYRPIFKDAHYMTSYILTINRTLPGFPNATRVISVLEKSIPLRDLRLTLSPVGGTSAN